MLEKPDLPDEWVIASLQAVYGIPVARLEFLPLGVDVRSAVYKVTAQDGGVNFLKLRNGDFHETSVLLPNYFSESGVQQIIPALQTATGAVWSLQDGYWFILYPFVEGKDGYEVELLDEQWVNFGKALKTIHSLALPDRFRDALPYENFSAQWREKVLYFQDQVEQEIYVDPVAIRLARFMRDEKHVIFQLVTRATELAKEINRRRSEYVLCHADIHPGNLLITPNRDFYIVDWDDAVFAPKERDLMFIGSGVGNVWSKPDQVKLFYQGYGQVEPDLTALAYYRYERVIQDIAAFCEQLLLSNEGDSDREQNYRFFVSSFLPGHEIEVAQKTDMLLREFDC